MQRLVLVILGALVPGAMVMIAAHADGATGPQPSVSTRHVDKDCSDFATQRAAQIYFLSIGGPTYDPDRLDADGDGIACEDNPCPCYYGTKPPSQPTPTPTPTPPPPPKRVKAVVVRVIDGEKVRVKLLPSSNRVAVQILGINSPAYGECGHNESRASLRRILPHGLRVWLYRDFSQADKTGAGRLLRYVNKASNGKDAGRVQIVRAWALPQKYAKSFTRESDYRTKAKLARQAKRGVWGLCYS